MNFKLNFISILLALVLVGCGVKSNPVPPADTMLPSVEDQYLENSTQNLGPIRKKTEDSTEKDNEQNP